MEDVVITNHTIDMGLLMNKAELLERMHSEWLSFIMRGDTAEETLVACEALIAGGAVLVEVAFTTPGVCDVIAKLRRRHEDRIILAAGTVRTPEEAQMAFDSGARVIVSPNLYAPVVETALKNGAISVPGCLTPTEVADALRLGADIIKLFPCYHVGPEYIRYLLAPFPEVRILPAGSIVLNNMQAYYESGAFAGVVGVTTEMQLLEAVKSKRWNEVTAVTHTWITQVKKICRKGKND